MSIQGNKPRKWVKNINYNNPTMYNLQFIGRHSHNLISIFNPQISRLYDSPIKYYRKNDHTQNLPNRYWDQNNISKNDSLDLSLKKYNTIQYQRTSETPRDSANQQRRAKIWMSKSVVQPDIKKQKGQNSPNIKNDQNTKSIRNKQLHGYNIISNY